MVYGIELLLWCLTTKGFYNLKGNLDIFRLNFGIVLKLFNPILKRGFSPLASWFCHPVSGNKDKKFVYIVCMYLS